MAIYMFKGTYTQASIQAMVENPVDRTALISKACESFGGKLLNVFMAFGEDDVIVITELPDDVTAADFFGTNCRGGNREPFFHNPTPLDGRLDGGLQKSKGHLQRIRRTVLIVFQVAETFPPSSS